MACDDLKAEVDKFHPEDPLPRALFWLTSTFSASIAAARSALSVWQEHYAFMASSSCFSLQQQLPNVKQLAQKLQNHLGTLLTINLGRSGRLEHVLDEVLEVLLLCQMQPKDQRARQGTFQWFLEQLEEEQVKPAQLTLVTLQRLAALLVLANIQGVA